MASMEEITGVYDKHGEITGVYDKHGGDNRCIWQAWGRKQVHMPSMGEITGAYGKHGGENRCICQALGL